MTKWSGGPPAISFAARQEARAPSAARAAEYAAVLVMQFIIIVSLSSKNPPYSFDCKAGSSFAMILAGSSLLRQYPWSIFETALNIDYSTQNNTCAFGCPCCKYCICVIHAVSHNRSLIPSDITWNILQKISQIKKKIETCPEMSLSSDILKRLMNKTQR